MQVSKKAMHWTGSRIAKNWYWLWMEAKRSTVQLAAWMPWVRAERMREGQEIDWIQLGGGSMKMEVVELRRSPASSGPSPHPPGTLPL